VVVVVFLLCVVGGGGGGVAAGRGGGGGAPPRSCNGENNYNESISVAARSKSLSVVQLACWDAGSNPVEDMDVCLL
jgi:hypothetical protein